MSDREEKIRRKAYELWEAAGHPHGDDQRFWHEAVVAVDAELKAKAKPAAKAAKPAEPVKAKAEPKAAKPAKAAKPEAPAAKAKPVEAAAPTPAPAAEKPKPAAKPAKAKAEPATAPAKTTKAKPAARTPLH